MWEIVITCVSLYCEPMPVVKALFLTKERCDLAIVHVAELWKPENGAHKFSCIQTVRS